MASAKVQGGIGEEFRICRDELIECISDHMMWDSEAFWKTVTDVTTGLRRIRNKSGKIVSLKDNIRIL